MKKKAPIHIVPTFHHDISYLKPERDYHANASRILDKAISLMEEDSEYTYTVEQAYFFERYWQENPDKQEKLVAFYKSGQLNFAPGFWVVPDMCMPSGESIYMQATYGKRALKNIFGGEDKIKTAFIADCWGHNAALPQILSQCGYDYYTFSRCMTKALDEENFIWRGLDGSDIKTHWMSTSYAGLEFKDSAKRVNAEELSWSSATREGVLSLYNQNAERCGGDAQLMTAGGDMKMPASSATTTVKQFKADDELPKISFSTMERAFSEIDFDDKKVYDGEFISSLKGSFATNIDIKHNNNKAENELYALEALSVFKNKKCDFDKAWKLTLKNQFHDIICGTLCDEALEDALREQNEALEQLQKIRKGLSGDDEALFNPHPFEVFGVLDKVSYKAKPFSFAETEPLSSVAATLPCKFQNEFYEAGINENGFITSLVEKQSGLETVGKGIPFGSLQLQADSGDNWVEFEYPWEDDHTKYSVNVPDPYNRSALERHRNVTLSKNGVLSAEAEWLSDGVLRITQKGRLNYWVTDMPFETTITFYKNSPRIDYKTEFDCKNRRLRLRAAFPSAIAEGVIRHNVPYGISVRGQGPQPANMFIDHQNHNAGLCLINRGNPANNIEDNIMMITLFRSVAMEYKCQSELSYNIGKHIVCEYSVVPHRSGEDIKLWENAISFNCPPVLTSREDLLGLKVESALLSAVRFDGDDIFLRIYNGCEDCVTAKITLPEGFDEYAFTDGLMNIATKKQKGRGKISLRLGGYKVQGIKLFKSEN